MRWMNDSIVESYGAVNISLINDIPLKDLFLSFKQEDISNNLHYN